MTYARTPEQRAGDYARAAEFENEVLSFLGEHIVSQTTATDKLDFWSPGYLLDVKEKRQVLTDRWTDGDLPEADAFVLDELSVRRACGHWPAAYFLIRDVPRGKYFVGSIVEVVCIERARLNRGGKGKWVIDLRDLYELPDLDGLVDYIQSDLIAMKWKRSDCLGAREPRQV